MRGRLFAAAGTAAAGVAVTAGLVLTAAPAAHPAAPVRVSGLEQTASVRTSTPAAVLARLGRPGGLQRYRFPRGELVWAQVCIGGSCASRQYSSDTVHCSGGTCLAPAEIARRYRTGMVITVQEW